MITFVHLWNVYINRYNHRRNFASLGTVTIIRYTVGMYFCILHFLCCADQLCRMESHQISSALQIKIWKAVIWLAKQRSSDWDPLCQLHDLDVRTWGTIFLINVWYHKCKFMPLSKIKWRFKLKIEETISIEQLRKQMKGLKKLYMYMGIFCRCLYYIIFDKLQSLSYKYFSF